MVFPKIYFGSRVPKTCEQAHIPLSAGVEVGDEIVTSGLGGRFPAGFPVGTITGLRPDDTHAFLVGELKPAAQLDRGRDVLLLRPGAAIRIPPELRLQLEETAPGGPHLQRPHRLWAGRRLRLRRRRWPRHRRLILLLR